MNGINIMNSNEPVSIIGLSLPNAIQNPIITKPIDMKYIPVVRLVAFLELVMISSLIPSISSLSSLLVTMNNATPSEYLILLMRAYKVSIDCVKWS